MLRDLEAAVEPDARPPPPSRPAPRVTVVQTGAGQAIAPIIDEVADLDRFRSSFLDAFGTVDEIVAESLFQQLVNGLHSGLPNQPIDCATANLALALMHSLGPKDVIEGMLACQMIVAHVAVMDAARRALHLEQTPGGRQAS
jgi:hypothetical protein